MPKNASIPKTDTGSDVSLGVETSPPPLRLAVLLNAQANLGGICSAPIIVHVEESGGDQSSTTPAQVAEVKSCLDLGGVLGRGGLLRVHPPPPMLSGSLPSPHGTHLELRTKSFTSPTQSLTVTMCIVYS